MDTIIRHGGWGHEVQESWPYLSNATPWPYELSHVENEFSLVGLTACQYENENGSRMTVLTVDKALETDLWGPFLESPGDLLGPKANFVIKACWILAQFLAHKPVNFALLTDTLMVPFSKLLILWSWMQTW